MVDKHPLVIVGAGGMGREVVDIVDAISATGDGPGYECLGFIDDGAPNAERLHRLGLAHLGGLGAVAQLPSGTHYVVAIADPNVRKRIANTLSAQGLPAATLIHPSVTVGRDVEIGEGSVICAGARLTTNLRIGQHVIINPNSTIGHDSRLEDYVTLSPLVAVSGEVVLEQGATMGTGSTINQGLRVGANAMVGAGACVVKDQPSGVVVVGVPARPLRHC